MRIAELYAQGLAGLPGITLPVEKPGYTSNVFWMYSVLIDAPFPLTRDEVIPALRQRGIDNRPFFHPLDTLPPYLSETPQPQALALSRTGLNLPVRRASATSRSTASAKLSGTSQDSTPPMPSASVRTAAPDVSVILPTYNERENICDLIDAVRTHLAPASGAMRSWWRTTIAGRHSRRRCATAMGLDGSPDASIELDNQGKGRASSDRAQGEQGACLRYWRH